MSRKVFKVMFREPNGRLTSACVRVSRFTLPARGKVDWFAAVRAVCKRFQKVYRTSKGARTHIGTCLAFDTLKHAVAFAKEEAGADPPVGCVANQFEVWRGKARSARRCAELASVFSDIPAFQRQGGRKDGWTPIRAPAGTLMCRDLIITEKVWPKEGE